MAEEGVNFERITRIYREETNKSTLTKLEADFYDKMNAYFEDLKSRANKEISKDAHSSKAVMLQDEVRKVNQKRDQIYRARERKIVLMASSRVGGTDVDIKVLTRNEKALFELLVGNLRGARSEIFAGEKPAPKKAEAEPVKKVEKKEPVPPKKEVKSEDPEESTAVIKVLEDIPAFAGIDVTYELKKEEVVTLPMKVARILSESGKAKVLEISNP